MTGLAHPFLPSQGRGCCKAYFLATFAPVGHGQGWQSHCLVAHSWKAGAMAEAYPRTGGAKILRQKHGSYSPDVIYMNTLVLRVGQMLNGLGYKLFSPLPTPATASTQTLSKPRVNLSLSSMVGSEGIVYLLCDSDSCSETKTFIIGFAFCKSI